ncbi:MAG: OmpA family protein, partial [Bacteroidota bacterium]
ANPTNCTPDYFHTCNQTGFSIPDNNCGNQLPVQGKGYVGFIARIGKPANAADHAERSYREHIQTKLLTPLEPYSRYIVRLHVALSDYSNFAVGNLGLLFTPTPQSIVERVAYEPQVKFEDIINDKQWVELVDTFIARGDETYLTIGEFESTENKLIKRLTKSTKFKKKFSYNRAYYYIDNVSVTFLDKLTVLTTPKIKETLAWEEVETTFGKLEVGKPIVLKNVFFEFGKAELLDYSKKELNQLVILLKAYPSMSITITGHTDNVGNDENNIRLSKNRAKSVYDYLVEQDISMNRLQFKGLGSKQPIDENATEKGRQKNRRVEFYVNEP